MDEQKKADINKCLIGVKNRDVESLNKLYDLIAHTIRYIALKYLRNLEDAQDLEQDFWADIYVLADKYNYIGNAFSYLSRIMTNMAINRYIKLYGEKQYVVRVVDYNQIYSYEQNQSMEKIENRIAVQNAFNKLDSVQQKIMQLWTFQHMTIVQIAKELKISRSQVGRLKLEAQENLKQNLSNNFWEKSEG